MQSLNSSGKTFAPTKTTMTPTADTIIIGGGVMGCSIAYNLAARGMTGVLLLEGFFELMRHIDTG